MRQLIWFRLDLRVQDHTALYYAMQQGPCIALAVISPEQWRMHDDAPIKIDFYLRQLLVLKQQLSELNIPLLIERIDLWSEIPQKLIALCQKHQVKCVHANFENGWNEQQRDLQVETHLVSSQITWQSYTDRTIFPLQSIRNKTDQPYQIFTSFKKNCYEQLSISLPQPFPNVVAQDAFNFEEFIFTEVPCIEELFNVEISAMQRELWPVGENYAQMLLEHFADERLQYYDQKRDYPALDSSSKMSAYLNIGIISIRQCLAVLFREQHGYFFIQQKALQIWLDELLWREFYQHVMADFSRVSKSLPFKKQTQSVAWRTDEQALEAWKYGKTGIPIVDAGMRQMLETGWMHNRVRMICAMFLSKNLLIDWREGEAWFMQHLIDGDLAANNGGWQWSASTGTDAVPYFRIFNPVSQSQKFDANGDYIRRWIPELAHLDHKQIHEPSVQVKQKYINYPRPIVDLKTSRQRAIDAFKLASAEA